MEEQKDQFVAAMERLQIWSEQTDWQPLFRNRNQNATTE
jgi:two-component system sensor histidine kinase BarA